MKHHFLVHDFESKHLVVFSVMESTFPFSETPVNVSDSLGLQTAKKYYNACMNVAELNNTRPKYILDIFRKVAGIPMNETLISTQVDVTKLLSLLTKYFGVTPLFSSTAAKQNPGKSPILIHVRFV